MQNSVRLIGNIGRDTEGRKTPNGKEVASTSIAITENYKDAQGNKVESTEWVNLDFWGNNAVNAVNLLKKGAGVILEGRLKTDSYEKNGVKTYSTKVVVESFIVTKYVTEKATA